jgi:hypothetical protein
MTTAKEVSNGPGIPPSFFKSVTSIPKSPVAPPDPGAQPRNREPLESEISHLPSPAAQEPAAANDLRCQFSFSDGRRCRMPRAAHHEYLCAHHASKEAAETRATSFPELEALCADLTTATNINRALTRVFLLLAQGRITERQALTFGSLARLLLRTVPAIRDEWLAAFGRTAYSDMLKGKIAACPAAQTAATSARPQDAFAPGNPGDVPARPDQPVPIVSPPRPAPISFARPGAPSFATSSPEPRASVTRAPDSAHSRPATAATEPRLVWVEALQRYVPESTL